MAALNWNCQVGLILVTVVVGFTCFVSITPAEAGAVKAKKCPGRCMSNVTDCKAKGGKIAGYCTNELPCCDYTYIKIGSCGAKKSNLKTAIFRSPDYPDYSKGDLICSFEFVLSPNASGITVDFTHVVMDGVGFVKDSPCESDMFFFKGFPNWTPPAQCGNLTNYVAVIDLGNSLTKGMKSLTILAVMSSPKYRWQIKVSQVIMKEAKKSTVTTTIAPIKTTENPDDDDVEDLPGEREKMLEPFDENEFSEVMEEDQGESETEELTRVLHFAKLSKGYYSDGDWLDGEEYTDPGIEEEPFIVNGDVIQVTTTPWQASLRTVVTPRLAKMLPSLKLKNCSVQEGIHFCGGTVISDRFVISATHCFYTGEKFRTWQSLSTMKVVLGDSNLCDESTDGVQEFKVDKVYYHYAYDHKVIMHDLVVIKLAGKVKFDERVKAIKLAEGGKTYENIEGLASGWGLTNLTIGGEARTPDELRSAGDLFIGNKSECIKSQKKLYPTLTENQIKRYPKYKMVFDSLMCSYVRNGSVPRVVGQGDSGGPLATFETAEKGSVETKPVLIGVISYMIPIGTNEAHDVSNYVDFYQSISYYRKWIDVVMFQK